MNKNRALLLDRDGVINIDHGYVGRVDRFDFMPGVFPFLRAARDRGFRLAILTNQSGVARGKYTKQDHEQVTAHMLAAMWREDIAIDLALACCEHPEGSVASYARESFWRKPNPGMVLEVIRRLDLDASRCAFLGDSWRDMQAAHAAQVGICLWLTSTQDPMPVGIVHVASFSEALRALSAGIAPGN